MSKKAPRYEDDLRERLRDPEYAAEYLNAVLESGEEGIEAVFLLALRQIAEAGQMNSVAARAGVNRENLYRMLSGKGNPRFANLLAVLGAVGLKLHVMPQEPSGAPEENVAELRPEDVSDVLVIETPVRQEYRSSLNVRFEHVTLGTRFDPELTGVGIVPSAQPSAGNNESFAFYA